MEIRRVKNLFAGNNVKIARNFFILGIFFLFGFTRLWQLATLPLGMHIDEAGMAYDAWCLSQYGVDRYLKTWPVYLTNFGSGQSSLYAFLCAFLFKLFGYSIFVMRIPAVIFSFLNLFFGMKIMHKVYPQKAWMAVVTGGLLTICPYFIMAGRLGLDCNLMLGMSTVFLYCVITAIKRRKIIGYIWAGIMGGALLYTYALTYIIVPIFLFLVLIYLIRVKNLWGGGFAMMMILLAIIATPLILVQIINMFDFEEFQLGCFTITKLQTYRVTELGHFQLDYLYQVCKSILWGDSLNYNSIPQYANLYWITNVFFLLGMGIVVWKFWNSIRKCRSETSVIILLWFVSIIILATHIDTNVNKVNAIFYSAVFFAVIGIDAIIHRVGKITRCFRTLTQRKINLTNVITCVLVNVLLLAYIICFTDFSVYYYSGIYSKENYLLSYFHVPVTEALKFIEEDEILCSKETQMVQPKIVYAVSTLIDPHELMIWEKEEGGEQFGNYRFNVLGEILSQNNYIVVREVYNEYCAQLHAAGFYEKCYNEYSLFYKK